MDTHFEAKPVGDPSVVLSGLAASSNETLAEAIIFFSEFLLNDPCLLCSLMAAYLLEMASLLELYLRDSSFTDFEGVPLPASVIKLVVVFIS